jgi:hypothetical protein
MADRKLTLLEVHFGDGTVQFGSSGAGETPARSSEPGDDDADGYGSGGPGRGVVLLLLVVLAGVAVSRLLGGGDLAELERLDDLADGR